MFKRMLSVLVLTLTLSVISGFAAKQGPAPDPSCGFDSCGNLK